MGWMMQETNHRNEVVRTIKSLERPSVFIVSDYLPQIEYHQALLDVGMVHLPNGHTWVLAEIGDSPDPETPDFSEFRLENRSPLYADRNIDAIRRVMDKKTVYRLAYSADDRTSTVWLGFAAIIGQITYKPGWYLRVGVEDTRMWVQVGVTEEAEISFDPHAGKKVPWRGAKHYLSPYMCRQEVVGTVFHAIERAEMHECKEWFRYKGRSIYNPHLDPDVLVEVASRANSFNTRDNAMTMEEPE